MAIVGAHGQDAVVLDDLHDLPPAGEGGHREAAADGLGKGAQVGGDAEVLLGASQRQAEAGEGLVKDHQHAIPGTQLPQSLQKAGLRHAAGHIQGHGLHDDAGDLIPLLLEQGGQPLQIVVFCQEAVIQGVGARPSV